MSRWVKLPRNARHGGHCSKRPQRKVRSAVRNKLDEEVGAIDPAQEAAPGGGQHQAHPGIARSSSSICSDTSFIAARLVPSGAVTRTSNSPSSTLLGRYSCRTSL